MPAVGEYRMRGARSRGALGVALVAVVLLAGGSLALALLSRESSAEATASSSATGTSATAVPQATSSIGGVTPTYTFFVDHASARHRIVIGGGRTTGHVCLVRIDGGVACWGANQAGQLGDGTTTRRLKPVVVPGISSAFSLAAGTSHTCVLIENGNVYCWGRLTGKIPSSSPFEYLGISKATAIAGGDAANCVVLWESFVQGCGDSGYPGFGMEAGVGDVTIGPGGCAIVIDRRVECWGRVGGRDFHGFVSGVTAARAISAGTTDTCAIVAGGKVRCWDIGSLGTDGSLRSYGVYGISGATAIAEGDEFGCAIVPGRIVRCWGMNDHGQRGDGTTRSPAGVTTAKGISGATAIAAGDSTTCVVLAGDDVRCWGANAAGQLGNGTRIDCAAPVGVWGLGRTSSVCRAPSDRRPSPAPKAPTPTPTS